jgi:hypothetical protein
MAWPNRPHRNDCANAWPAFRANGRSTSAP